MKISKLIGAGAAIIGSIALSKLFGKKEPAKYSDKWFDTVSDEVLETEREIVRKQFCASGHDFSLASSLQRLLRQFDSVMSKRAWGGETPHPPSFHREHGFNLFKKG